MILTGCQPWTLYNETQYEGDAFCLFPSDVDNCYPNFYETPQDLNGLANNIKSVRQGCFSSNTLKGKSVLQGELQSLGLVASNFN